MSISQLSSQLLIESYEKAKKLNLQEDLIDMLENELHRRKF